MKSFDADVNGAKELKLAVESPQEFLVSILRTDAN